MQWFFKEKENITHVTLLMMAGIIVCMGCIRTRRLSKLGTVDISREIRIDLVLGYFRFTIHDLVPFRDLLSRVMLYIRKGFHLKQLRFHRDCSAGLKCVRISEFV